MTVVAISNVTVAAIVAVVLLDLFAIAFGLSFVRARKAQRAAEEAVPGVPAAEEALPRAVTRREFFRRSLLASFGVFLAQFGGATLAFMWPNLRGGFGSIINAGNLDDIKAQIQQTGQPFYSGIGRFYIVPYDGKPEDDINYGEQGAMKEGIMPLYQRCVHLGCRVPFCQSSQWFECPCHGSKYNTAGEYKQGPAPTGLERFRISIENGNVMVDTSERIPGPPRGTDTTKKPQAGPFCVPT